MNSFYKKKDNRHIIEGHDTTEIFVTRERSYIVIEVDHRSSYDYEGKRVVFKGYCETLEFFKQVLDSVLKY